MVTRIKLCSPQILLIALTAVLTFGTLKETRAAGDDGERARLWGEHWREDLAAWRRAKTPAAQRRLAEVAIDSAMHAMDGPNVGDHPEVVEEVIAGGRRALRDGEVRVPRGGVHQVSLTTLRDFSELRDPAPDHWPAEQGDWLARRITADHFEVWSPKHGWLFDRAGRLLNEAKPPRRDGVGREWFGAFLPDGRGATTDLWEWDRVLTFFSRESKWLREIPGATLVPRTPEAVKDTGWKSTGTFSLRGRGRTRMAAAGSCTWARMAAGGAFG